MEPDGDQAVVAGAGGFVEFLDAIIVVAGPLNGLARGTLKGGTRPVRVWRHIPWELVSPGGKRGMSTVAGGGTADQG